MRILVVGSWHTEKAMKYVSEARQLGILLAERKHTLVTSPSSGFQGLVAKTYKINNGPEFIGYFPDLKLMEENEEKAFVHPDTPIYTNQDYPIRNILQIRGSDAVIGVTGGSGTLTELIASINDYKLPTAFYEGSSRVVDMFRDIEPNFAKLLKYEKNIVNLLNHLEESVRK